MAVDRDDLVATLARLVQINSVNPTLVPGAPGEREIAAYVGGWLASAGLEVRTLESTPGRPSIVARLPGTGRGRSLMLNAHIDTVDVAGMPEPLSGAIRNGRLYGRGSYDMKGSLAACMMAARTLAAAKRLGGDLIVAAVADEEYGSLGTAELVTSVRTDAAIVTEPTSLRVCRAHKGYLWIEVEVLGRAAHGSRFDQGVDANIRMGRFLSLLDGLERELRGRPPHVLVGPPSLHAAQLEGGSGLSTYAARSVLRIERRTVPGETEAGAMAEIESLLDRLRRDDATFQGSARAFFVREPFEVEREAGIVHALDAAAAEVLLHPPEHIGDTPWMDSALLAGAGIGTVVFGPHGAGAHADEEWVDLDSVVQTADVLVKTAEVWCA
ncbi:MAG TPA: M20/M25/M40 family metallo-hydrolase [Gemmatimonadales bacterium]|jgi:acetylornithine deacetylase|nr:M20/M25/M40 family metallo-hydrolase [Gemmatimonadales bacterium]